MLNENTLSFNTGLHTPSNSFEASLHIRGACEATMFPVREPILHYTLNAPFQYAVFKKIIKA